MLMSTVMEPPVPDYILESVRSLPPLPAAVQRLLTLARDAEADFGEVSRVIESDQTLTARTLRAANSAFYGVPRRVETVRQATVLLGSDTIVNLALGVSVLGLQERMDRQWPLDAEAFWRHSLAVATAARLLARALPFDDADSAFVAGLLHDIGKLVMLDHFGDVYGQVLLAAQDGTRPLPELEREILGVDHAAVGQALCLHWNLPAHLTRAVAEHHDDAAPGARAIPDLVRDANRLVKLAHLGTSGNPFVPVATDPLAPHRQIHPSALHRLLDALPAQVREAEAVFGRSADAAPPPEAPPQLVHLEVTQPAERALLALTLRAMGYEPRLLDEDPPDAEGPGDCTLAGLITDLPITPARAFAYQKYNVPMLDYATWRADQNLPETTALNVDQLRAWLQTELDAPPAAARAA
ncbi:MAG: HDOD domain-containing protein [Bacteroidetes bacterium]|nr:MAG: HDOD domain-containing protein [Bacteroidota bacterium]